MADSEFSKRLRCITISPLIVGIIVCSIICVAIMFNEHLEWMNNFRNELLTMEAQSLNRKSASMSDSYSILITTDLMFLSSTYEGIYSGTLVKSAGLAYGMKRFEESKSEIYLAFNANEVTWYSKSLKNITNLDQGTFQALIATNAFMVDVQNKISDFVASLSQAKTDMQVGLILNNGVDMRYPAQDMSSTLLCGGKQYDPLASKFYKEAYEYNANVFYECGVLVISQRFKSGVFNCYLSLSTLQNIMTTAISEDNDHIYFISSSDFTQTIIITSVENDYSSGPCDLIFPSDKKLQTTCKNISTVSLNQTMNVTLSGYNTFILGSCSPVFESVILSGAQRSTKMPFTSGVFINKRVVVMKWRNLIEDLFKVIILQVIIFSFFIFISILIAIKLSTSIVSHILNPIKVIEEILRNNSKQEIHAKYNKEVNKVIEFLALLNEFEEFIDPHFLNNPDITKRKNNLEKAYGFFQRMKNHRGMAIVQNLIGNTNYSGKFFIEAEENYKKALRHTMDLLGVVQKQQSLEEELYKNEKSNQKRRLKMKSWESEETYLYKNIIERKHQICMALHAQVGENAVVKEEARAILKEMIKYQQEILEYYISARTYYMRLVKVLLDMAFVYHKLQYYYTGCQLLEIVKDELIKIEHGQLTEVDIDVTRMRSIGIQIEVDKVIKNNLHFSLEDNPFEKDVLMQHMYFRQGKILCDMRKPEEAARAFISAIVMNMQESGKYYDPKIRQSALTDLQFLIEEYKLQDHLEPLEKFSTESADAALLFVLAYDHTIELNINYYVIKFAKELNPIDFKIGAVLSGASETPKLELCKRDCPAEDLENLLKNTKHSEKYTSIFDVLVNALLEFENCKPNMRKYMVVIAKGYWNEVGAARVEDLDLFIKNIKTIVVDQDNDLPYELIKSFEENGCRMIAGEEVENIESDAEKIKKIIEIVQLWLKEQEP